MSIPLFHLNAFTDSRFGGNPAAVCLLNSWLDDGWLRKVAAENNLSATAFLVPSGEDYELRWFTPLCEIKLCGHATLAAASVVSQILKPGINMARFLTRSQGVLTVKKDANLFLMDLPALPPEVCADPPSLLRRALGLRSAWTEVLEVNETYIVVLDNELSVHNVRPDVSLLEELHPFAVAITAPGEESDFVSRYFAPSYGVPEDPVTGSSHCALTPYWARKLGKSQLHARQLSSRGGELWCELHRDRVLVKGGAVLTFQGTLQITREALFSEI